MRRLTLLSVLIAFVFSCGGQWYVLQAIAWTNMIHEYSQTVPLSEAVAMTLSGKYPCELCKIIAQKKQAENLKIAAQEKETKKRLDREFRFAAAPPVIAPKTFPRRDEVFSTRSDTPPTPPPRSA